jgi:hypothetical protein
VADLLDKASAWLEEQRLRHMTQTVVYQRGSNTVNVPATIGTTMFQVDDGAGALLRVEARDYLIRATDLLLGGTPVLPQRGDRIRETQGTQVFVYEVVAPGDEPCWRYSDPYRRTLRIHTKQVDQETTP